MNLSAERRCDSVSVRLFLPQKRFHFLFNVVAFSSLFEDVGSPLPRRARRGHRRLLGATRRLRRIASRVHGSPADYWMRVTDSC